MTELLSKDALKTSLALKHYTSLSHHNFISTNSFQSVFAAVSSNTWQMQKTNELAEYENKHNVPSNKPA